LSPKGKIFVLFPEVKVVAIVVGEIIEGPQHVTIPYIAKALHVRIRFVNTIIIFGT